MSFSSVDLPAPLGPTWEGGRGLEGGRAGEGAEQGSRGAVGARRGGRAPAALRFSRGGSATAVSTVRWCTMRMHVCVKY